MKKHYKLYATAIMLITIAMAKNAIAQSNTDNYIGKWSNFYGQYVDVSTVFYDDVTNSKIGVGTTSPGAKFTISAAGIQQVLDANGTSNPEIRLQNSGSSKLEIGIPTTAGNYINGSAVNDVIFRQTGGQKILFSTSASGSTNDLTLSAGKVGIGTTTPGQSLQVVGGNIDVKTSTNSYMINGTPVLWHNNITGNIYVGVGAGNGTSTTGQDNTLVGNGAGTAVTTGNYTTFVGFEAGKSNTTSDNNTAVGYQALYSAVTLSYNTAIGYQALYNVHTQYSCCIGGLNTAVGYQALKNSDAYGGCAFGFNAGLNNTLGCSLIAIGEEAAISNTLGDDNVAVGEVALHDNKTFGNNVAIGTHSLEHQTDANTTKSDSYNVAVGNYALDYTNAPTIDPPLGIDNTAVGDHAGAANITGKNNSFLGYHADVSITSLHNSAAIGANAITTNSNEMILGDNSIYVGIGYSANATYPPGKLSVEETVITNVITPTVAGYFHNGDPSTGITTALDKKGVYGISEGHLSPDPHIFSQLNNIGGDFQADNSEVWNIGVRGRADINPSITAGLTSIGGLFEGNKAPAAYGSYSTGQGGSIDNTGVVGISGGGGSGVNYGIYGSAPFGTCNIVTCTDAAGFFNGDVGSTGTGYYLVSDASLKDNIQPLQNATTIINQLNPKSYTFKTTQYPAINLPLGTQMGLLAQDVESILPGMVKKFKILPRRDSLGNLDTTNTGMSFKAINYYGLIPILVQANKEQKNTIDTLKLRDSTLESRVTALEQLVNTCCNSGHHSIGSPSQGQDSNGSGSSQNTGSNDFPLKQTIDLASSDPILYQNQPNPFDHTTVIRYFIPSNADKPKIIFQDETGRTINETLITQLGQGSIQVNSSLLNSGVYTYSLQIAGKIIDSKKMVKAK